MVESVGHTVFQRRPCRLDLAISTHHAGRTHGRGRRAALPPRQAWLFSGSGPTCPQRRAMEVQLVEICDVSRKVARYSCPICNRRTSSRHLFELAAQVLDACDDGYGNLRCDWSGRGQTRLSNPARPPQCAPRSEQVLTPSPLPSLRAQARQLRLSTFRLRASASPTDEVARTPLRSGAGADGAGDAGAPDAAITVGFARYCW